MRANISNKWDQREARWDYKNKTLKNQLRLKKERLLKSEIFGKIFGNWIWKEKERKRKKHMNKGLNSKKDKKK